MTDHDDVLMELEAALRAEPSREFAAGVRARVGRSQVQTRRMWWGLAAAATVTLATVALWRPKVVEPVTMTAAPPQVATPVMANHTSETVVEGRRPAPVVARVAVTPRPAAVLPPLVSTEPRLEVITNQPEVLRQLWAGYGARTLQETPTETQPPATSADARPLAPVAVEPIVVVPIVVSELVPGGRGGGAPIIRRVEATKEPR